MGLAFFHWSFTVSMGDLRFCFYAFALSRTLGKLGRQRYLCRELAAADNVRSEWHHRPGSWHDIPHGGGVVL